MHERGHSFDALREGLCDFLDFTSPVSVVMVRCASVIYVCSVYGYSANCVQLEMHRSRGI